MRTKVYTRPKVSEVRDWYMHYQSELVSVEQAMEPYCDLYRVKVKDKRAEYFFGEMAWMNARRVAADADFAAWNAYCY